MERIDRLGDLVVLRATGRFRLLQGRSAADDIHDDEADAGSDDDLDGVRGRLGWQPVRFEQPVTHTTPPDTTPPSPPPTLSLTSVYPTRISVSWTASVDNITQTWNTLLVDGKPFIWDTIGGRGATVLHLTPSSTHTFKVTARDGYGNSVESNVLTVTTPAKTDDVAPSPPTNLRFSFQTDPPELWLEWDQSTDGSDPQSLILYEVYLNGVFSEDGLIGGGRTITYCREPGPTEVVLTAVDTSGNESAPSNALRIDC